MLVSTPLPLTPVPIDQRITCQNPSHRFLNMLHKAHHMLLLAQFAVINAVVNYINTKAHRLRFLILSWRIKRFYVPLRTPLNHYFWLDLSIRQTFPRQNFVRVSSPNFSPAKLSRYTVCPCKLHLARYSVINISCFR